MPEVKHMESLCFHTIHDMVIFSNFSLIIYSESKYVWVVTHMEMQEEIRKQKI